MRIAYNPKSASGPLTTAPTGDYLNAITFDLIGHNIFARGEMFKGTDTTYEVFRKATQSAVGYNGLVPAPSYTGTSIRFLRENGTWEVPNQRPIKLGGGDFIKETDYNKVLDIHSGNGITIDYDNTGKITINSTLEVDGDFSGTISDAFTQVKVGVSTLKATTNKALTFSADTGIILTPNTTTNTIQIAAPIMVGATENQDGIEGLVPKPITSDKYLFLRGDGIWAAPNIRDYGLVTNNTDGVVPKFDASDGTINNSNNWVLTINEGAIGWYQLPTSAFNPSWDSITNKPETYAPSEHTHPTSQINSLNGYSYNKTLESTPVNLTTTDTLNQALAKLEHKANQGVTAYNWYIAVTEEDSDVYINKWNEIVDFLNELKESDGDILDQFVTLKTDQTIEGSKIFTNNISALGFVKQDSNDNNILLGGGGHKPISDFLLKSEAPAQELTNNLITLTKNLKVTQAWMDTGISGTDLATGTYVIQVTVNDGNMPECIWSGTMSWYNGTCSDTETDEILLHRSGKAYSDTIYLRTIMQSSGVLKLQISADENLSASYDYTFKFKRVI